MYSLSNPPNNNRSSPENLVSSSLVTRITLHNPLPRWAHTYILPFLPLYPFFSIIYFFKYDDYIGSEEWTFVYLGSLITLNALAWLCVHWSVKLEAAFTATKVYSTCNRLIKAKSVAEATLVKVEPGPNQGKSEMCKLEHVTVFPGEKVNSSSLMILFRRVLLFSRRNGFFSMLRHRNSMLLYFLLTLPRNYANFNSREE